MTSAAASTAVSSWTGLSFTRSAPAAMWRLASPFEATRPARTNAAATRRPAASSSLETGNAGKFFETTPAKLVDAELKPGDVRLYDTGGNHYQDWLDAIRRRTQPVCDVQTGHRSATVCNVANIAYRLNRPLRWNPESETFADDAEANALTKAPGRAPFTFKDA